MVLKASLSMKAGLLRDIRELSVVGIEAVAGDQSGRGLECCREVPGERSILECMAVVVSSTLLLILLSSPRRRRAYH